MSSTSAGTGRGGGQNPRLCLQPRNQSRERGRAGGLVRQVPGRRGGWLGHRPWGVRVGDAEGGAGKTTWKLSAKGRLGQF